MKVLKKGQIFNNKAFYKNSYSNICGTSIGFSQIAQLDLERFQECIKHNQQERQKYKMMLDQIKMQGFNNLCLIRCYACGKSHDIDECYHNLIKKRIFKNKVFNNIKEKEELTSVQLKMAKLQDSIYYHHQKQFQNQIESKSQHTPSKYQKCHTNIPQQQYQRKSQRSHRRSYSSVSESEKGGNQVLKQQQQDKPTSKNGITSSRFTDHQISIHNISMEGLFYNQIKKIHNKQN